MSYQWWQTGVIYQIYPRSFQDSNGDGIGDLPGILSRLDYLQWLGVKGVWVSPIYPSPMADFGYDVADYTDVHPIFGTLADLDALIDAAHQRDMKIILDFVPNHSSHQHPWFIESRSSRDNPKRDWYIWRDPAPDGGPPNNWLSYFTGLTGWTWDEHTQQYYYHSFLAEQPELNWRNPDLRATMLDVLRFWFERGVDGFRVDVAWLLMKDPDFRNNPENPHWRPGNNPFNRLLQTYTANLPEVHKASRWMRQVADDYDERVLIGEIYLDTEELVQHYGAELDEYHLPFNFQLIHIPWLAGMARKVVDGYEAALPPGAWPNYVLGNHDQHRLATRIGHAQARVGMMMLLTLRGTPTIYYGDELGMVDGEIPPDKVQDPQEINVPGMGLGRDPERTPMQWSAEPNAGFTDEGVEPWLPVAAGFEQRNVAAQRDDPRSMLRFTQRLLTLRDESPALNRGGYRSLEAPSGVFAYQRHTDDQRFVVLLNFTTEPRLVPSSILAGRSAEVTLSTYVDSPAAISEDGITLRPAEGLLLAIR